MPGSLTDSNAIELVSSNFIDHAIMPTILDQAVIVSNIKAAIQLKKYIPDVRMLWNNTLHHEKEQLYQQHTATIEDSYNINVCKCRVKNSGYLRREYGSDSIFIKSTLCYPEKTIKEKKLLFNDIFQELL